jgi:truncated hemoglobin YjbI
LYPSKASYEGMVDRLFHDRGPGKEAYKAYKLTDAFKGGRLRDKAYSGKVTGRHQGGEGLTRKLLVTWACRF